jgi:hypothetical protein
MKRHFVLVAFYVNFQILFIVDRKSVCRNLFLLVIFNSDMDIRTNVVFIFQRVCPSAALSIHVPTVSRTVLIKRARSLASKYGTGTTGYQYNNTNNIFSAASPDNNSYTLMRQVRFLQVSFFLARHQLHHKQA